MKKSDLKQLIKPLVKECIHEVLIEEGLLSNVVAEVAKGMQGNLVVESKVKQDDRLFNEGLQMKRKSKQTNIKLEEHRRKMMDSARSHFQNPSDEYSDDPRSTASRRNLWRRAARRAIPIQPS